METKTPKTEPKAIKAGFYVVRFKKDCTCNLIPYDGDEPEDFGMTASFRAGDAAVLPLIGLGTVGGDPRNPVLLEWHRLGYFSAKFSDVELTAYDATESD